MASSVKTDGSISLVVETVEGVFLRADTEYYVRACLGQYKLGTQSQTIQNDRLEFYAHTYMQSACITDPVLSLELINSEDEVVGVRRITEWRKWLEGHNKGVLRARLYAPEVELQGDESPMLTGKELEQARKIGVIQVRLYLAPAYREYQKLYDRLDIHIAKIVDLMQEELIESPPRILLHLGEAGVGVDVPGAPRKIEGEPGWRWEQSLSFRYAGEDELRISLRESKTDAEIGKAILFISQVVYHHEGETRKAGTIPICDAYGTSVGQLVIGTELWNHEHVASQVSTKYPDLLAALTARLEFDEALAKDVASATERHTGKEEDHHQETDMLFVRQRLSAARNELEVIRVDRDMTYSGGLVNRKAVRDVRRSEIERAELVERELHKAETRLFHLACDSAKAIHARIKQQAGDSQTLLRRCRLDLASTPRRGAEGLISDQELESKIKELDELCATAHRLKEAIYQTPALNEVPENLKQLRDLGDRSVGIHDDLLRLDDSIRDQIDAVRKLQRVEQLRRDEAEKSLLETAPVIVQRTGCFACCG